MKKIVLPATMLCFLSTAMLLCVAGLLRLQIASASPYTSIDVDTGYNMITNGTYPNLVILDVRTTVEYDIGHIDGAVSIPFSELEARIGELAGHENHEIIVYCNCVPPGGASEIAADILDSNNFTKVYDMVADSGAFTEWQNKGYPTIPEFPSSLILPLFMLITLLLTVIACKRKYFM